MRQKVSETRVVGRFAPSPTGPLHIGSLVTAVGSYCLARQAAGRWLVRIEDLDGPRVVAGADRLILNTLEGFGLHWDGEVVYQSRRSARYQQALEALRRRGLVFDCACSRKEVLASAPHSGEEGPVYPGTCRHGLAEGRRSRALRIRVPEETVCFSDGVFGPMQQCLASAVGDFVLRRADGLFAYQLAVVVDDADCGVNQVVRGTDLLGSTARQVYLHSCLGTAVPQYVHLPLALSENGEKISKRHGGLTCPEPSRAAATLWRIFEFLGQRPPADLQQGAAEEVLAWGVANFCCQRVPRQSSVYQATGG